MPSPFSSISDPKGNSVATQMFFEPPVRRTYEFRGKRQSFRHINIRSLLVGSSDANRTEPAGSLLFNENGTLAAYFPVIGGWSRLPSTLYHYGPVGSSGTQTSVPPFALTGKLKEMWNDGVSRTPDLPAQVYVPAPVSPDKRNEILATIEDRVKSDDAQKSVDGDRR